MTGCKICILFPHETNIKSFQHYTCVLVNWLSNENFPFSKWLVSCTFSLILKAPVHVPIDPRQHNNSIIIFNVLKILYTFRTTRKFENKIYNSHVTIGRCHDQRPGLPNGVGPTDVMYGVKTIKGKLEHLVWMVACTKHLTFKIQKWVQISSNKMRLV